MNVLHTHTHKQPLFNISCFHAEEVKTEIKSLMEFFFQRRGYEL